MKINYVKFMNWKSFVRKTVKFDQMNIINFPNGYGKTSIFEGIIFALYAKRPYGLTFSDLKNDPDSDTIIELSLDFTDAQGETNNIIILRKFNRYNGSGALYLNNEMLTSNSTEMFNYIDNIIPYNIVSVLWSEDSLKYSKILKPEFLISEIFEYIFKDPKKIQKYYKNNIFSLNKQIKQLESGININVKKEIEDIDKQLKQIQENLKGQSIEKYQHNQAIMVKQAVEALKEFDLDKVIENRDDIARFEGILKNRNKADLLMQMHIRYMEEKTKVSESPMSLIDHKTLVYIMEESENIGKNIISDDVWRQETSKKIKDLLKKGTLDKGFLENLGNGIELLKKYEVEDVEYSKKYYKLLEVSKSMDNYQEIIDQYNEETNSLWNKFNQLSTKRQSLERQNIAFDNYMKLKDDLDKEKAKLNLVETYILDASKYYSNNITNEASDILNSLNPRYDQLFLEDGKYQVAVLGQDMQTLSLSNILKLSSGEKTLVAVSLVLAAHKLFFPNIPLLFDESFSALDKENIGALKERFKKNNFQTFIITHDKYWTE